MITTKHCLQKKEDHETLAAVRSSVIAAAKAAMEAGRHDTLDIALPTGKHTLTEPFVLSVTENPELAHIDLSVHGTFSEGTSISSLVRLDGSKFERAEGKPYFTYRFKKPKGLPRPSVRELFLNYNKIETPRSASWINEDPLSPEERSGAKRMRGFYAPIALAQKLAEGPIGTTELVLYLEWEAAIFHVTGVDLSKTKTTTAGVMALLLIDKKEMDTFATSAPGFLNINNRPMFVRNAPALLDEAENTFAFDAKTGTLYLNPKDKVHMWCHAIEYPACDTLFYIDGMKNVSFRDITFTGVSSTYASSNLYYAGQANCLRGVSLSGGYPRGRLFTAAILAKDVRDFTVERCIFRDIGAYGVQVKDHSVCVTVKDSVFKNVGMSAVSVGNPAWDWTDKSNRNFNLRIENNHFEHIAYDYPTSPCLYVGMVDGLKILHNTILDCAYSGMSVGWGWLPGNTYLGERCNVRDAEIAYNKICDYMQLLRDGGATYVLGGNVHKDACTVQINFLHDNYASLTQGPAAEGAYGYYCDGSASNWGVFRNVIINCKRPLFSQLHEGALSYHNHFTEIYSNTPNHHSAHVPARDIITKDYYYHEGNAEALFEAYPVAKSIRDAAGAHLILP